MPHSVSPLAPKSFPHMPEIAGVRFATAEAGIKYKNRTDVLLAVFDKGTQVAGVFTRSKCRSAPVDWCADALRGGTARALLVNSGNANAFTGRRGKETVRLSAAMVAKAVGCPAKQVFLASTGVIGEPLPAGKFEGVVGDLAGTVERVGLKTTRVKSLSGEQLVFANAQLLNSQIRNYKRMQERRIAFAIGVTYETPLEKLRALVTVGP